MDAAPQPWIVGRDGEGKGNDVRHRMGKPRKVDSPKKKEGGKASGWAPEIRPKHRKSLPNGRQQGGAFGAAQGGGASRRPLGVLVVFHLVRIYYVLA